MPATAVIRNEAPEYLGVFAPRRAGVLAGIKGRRIGQWARRELIRPSVYHGQPANLYAFADVAEAIVIHWLLDHDYTLDEIREAAFNASDSHPEWPLARAQIGIAKHAPAGDTRGVIVQRLENGGWVEISRPSGQIVTKPDHVLHAADMLHRGGWIAAALNLDRIEVDPLKMGGRITLRGRRWPVEDVASAAADDEGRRILIEDYGFEPVEIDQSIRYIDAAMTLV